MLLLDESRQPFQEPRSVLQVRKMAGVSQWFPHGVGRIDLQPRARRAQTVRAVALAPQTGLAGSRARSSVPVPCARTNAA